MVPRSLASLQALAARQAHHSRVLMTLKNNQKAILMQRYAAQSYACARLILRGRTQTLQDAETITVQVYTVMQALSDQLLDLNPPKAKGPREGPF